MPRVVGVIQARMGSRRLPGKALLPIGGKTALAYLVDRVRRAELLHELVVATSTESDDDAIAREAARVGIRCFRGSEDDVLGRVAQAGRTFGAEVVVRLTADDVLMDPAVVDYMVQQFGSGVYHYGTGLTTHSFPNGFVLSVLRVDALAMADALPLDRVAREHVLPAFLNRPDLFSRLDVVAPPQWRGYEVGLTLDTQADYELLCDVVRLLSDQNGQVGLEEILQLVRGTPGFYERSRRSGGY